MPPETTLLSEVQELTLEVRRRDRLIITLLATGVLLFSFTLITAVLGAKAALDNNKILEIVSMATNPKSDLQTGSLARIACLKLVIENKEAIPSVCEDVRVTLRKENIIP